MGSPRVRDVITTPSVALGLSYHTLLASSFSQTDESQCWQGHSNTWRKLTVLEERISSSKWGLEDGPPLGCRLILWPRAFNSYFEVSSLYFYDGWNLTSLCQIAPSWRLVLYWEWKVSWVPQIHWGNNSKLMECVALGSKQATCPINSCSVVYHVLLWWCSLLGRSGLYMLDHIDESDEFPSPL